MLENTIINIINSINSIFISSNLTVCKLIYKALSNTNFFPSFVKFSLNTRSKFIFSNTASYKSSRNFISVTNSNLNFCSTAFSSVNIYKVLCRNIDRSILICNKKFNILIPNLSASIGNICFSYFLNSAGSNNKLFSQFDCTNFFIVLCEYIRLRNTFIVSIFGDLYSIINLCRQFINKFFRILLRFCENYCILARYFFLSISIVDTVTCESCRLFRIITFRLQIVKSILKTSYFRDSMLIRVCIYSRFNTINFDLTISF